MLLLLADVNECEAEELDVCGAGVCRNVVGGYNCVCPEGYRSTQGGRKCEGKKLFCDFFPFFMTCRAM